MIDYVDLIYCVGSEISMQKIRKPEEMISLEKMPHSRVQPSA